jgi:hypothetical protein
VTGIDVVLKFRSAAIAASYGTAAPGADSLTLYLVPPARVPAALPADNRWSTDMADNRIELPLSANGLGEGSASYAAPAGVTTGDWLLKIVEADLTGVRAITEMVTTPAGPRRRLMPDTLDDILLIARYRAG